MTEIPDQFEPAVVWTGTVALEGKLSIPGDARGIVLFLTGAPAADSTPAMYLASELNRAGFATLLLDLLTADEHELDARNGQYRLDADLFAERLVTATEWVRKNERTASLPIGYFGIAIGGAAALIAAADRPELAAAVVSSGGRTDLAIDVLRRIKAATLLIVAGKDLSVLRMNREALALLHCEKRLEIIRDEVVLDEPHTLEFVAQKAVRWFQNALVAPVAADGYGMVYSK